MTTAWRNAVVLLTLALAVLLAGVFILGKAWSVRRAPEEVQAVTETLETIGGTGGLTSRREALAELHRRLDLERLAKGSDAVLFNQRLEEIFDVLGLTVTASSAWTPSTWKPLPNAAGERSVAFERTFSGFGSFGALLAAIRTLESWPDGVRLRALSITPEAAETVTFTFEVLVLRMSPPAAGTEIEKNEG